MSLGAFPGLYWGDIGKRMSKMGDSNPLHTMYTQC